MTRNIFYRELKIGVLKGGMVSGLIDALCNRVMIRFDLMIANNAPT